MPHAPLPQALDVLGSDRRAIAARLAERPHAGRVAGAGGSRDKGAVAVVVPILAVGLMAMAGLVVDGGTALAARGRAADVAQQAARAGADALAPASLRRSRPDALIVDPQAARAAAQRVLGAGGVHGQVEVAADSVTVRATVTKRTAILSAVGLNTVHGSASSTASVLYGGTGQER